MQLLVVTVDSFLKNVHRWSVLIQGKVALSLASSAGDWHSWARSWGHPWAWLEIHACERKARHFSCSWKAGWVCQSIAWSSRHLSLKRRGLQRLVTTGLWWNLLLFPYWAGRKTPIHLSECLKRIESGPFPFIARFEICRAINLKCQLHYPSNIPFLNRQLLAHFFFLPPLAFRLSWACLSFPLSAADAFAVLGLTGGAAGLALRIPFTMVR